MTSPLHDPHAAVLGGGSWGTALSLVLAQNGWQCSLWARDVELAEDIVRSRENRRYLPGHALPERVNVTSSLPNALHRAEMVIWAVPSDAVRETAELAQNLLPPETVLVSAAKGLEAVSGLRMSQVLAEVLPGFSHHIAALSGPNLAVEIARGLPAAAVAASLSSSARQTVQGAFTRMDIPTFRVYTNHDIVGVELGGAIKNVIAIAAGVCEGLGMGDNARAALMTRGLAEAMRLGSAIGAEPHTFLGLSGVGDLIATAISTLSRNYRVGLAIGSGRSLGEVLDELGQVAEGVPTTRVLWQLAERYSVPMPLARALYGILFEHHEPGKAMTLLLQRPAGAELS